MSNKIKKIADEVKEQKHIQELTLATTLVGNMCLLCAIVKKEDTDYAFRLFDTIQKSLNGGQLENWTVTTLFDYVMRFAELSNKQKDTLMTYSVLITDTENKRSPMITLVDEDGALLPITQNGMSYGILGLAREGRSNCNVEYIWDIEGEQNND